MPVGALGDPRGPLADRIEAVEAALLATTQASRPADRAGPSCAASIAFQGIAAQVVAPLFAAVAVHGVLPDAAAADVARALHWRPGGGGPWLWWPGGGRVVACPGSRRPRCPGHGAARPGRRRRPGAGRGRRAGAVGQRRRRPWRARGSWSRRPPGRRPARRRRRPAPAHDGTVRGHGDAARPRTARRRLDLPAPLVLPLLPGPRRRDLRRLRAAPAGPPNPHRRPRSLTASRLDSTTRTGRRWRSRPAPATRPGRWSSPQRVRGRDPRCTSSEE